MTIHHITNIYANSSALSIAEEVHIAYVQKHVPLLNRLKRLALRYDNVIGVAHLRNFAPETASLAEKDLNYKEGDQITVHPEIGYIEKCLRLVFQDRLHTTVLRVKIHKKLEVKTREKLQVENHEKLRVEINEEENHQLSLITGKVFRIDKPLTELPDIDLPQFPEEDPDIAVASPEPDEDVFTFSQDEA